MSAPLPFVPRAGARALALAALAAVPLAAQPPQPAAASPDSTARPAKADGWLARVSVSARAGELRPAGRSELFALMDRALAPGGGALRPRLAGGALHVRVAGAWGVLAGVEAGGRTVASVSRAQPASGGEVRQQTALDLTGVHWLGAEWRGLRWRGAGADAPDRLRLVLGAGGGTARYRLRHWGAFVDADRGMAFADDFGSTGRGAFAYGSAALEVPLGRGLAVQGELRRQAGSAPMTADFASFDRLDLGGTRVGVGLLVRPAALLGRR
jgi:hypothetical protein